jgi:hypothetical protein
MINRRDPTRSAGLRRQGRAMGNRRVFDLHRQLRMTLQDNDVSGLRQTTPDMMQFTLSPEYRLANSEFMVRGLVTKALESPPDWLRGLIERAVQKGVEQVGQEMRSDLDRLDAAAVASFHAGIARLDIENISNETQRRMLRHVVRAIETRASPEALMREVRDTLEKITRARLTLLINMAVVRAVNAGKLFAYAESGVKQVGIDPEWLPARHTHDAAPVLAAKALERRRKYRQTRRRTVARELAVAAEAALQALNVVHILTAGDDRVCNICQDIAAEAPYEINTALSLIPAHPNCRCAFVAFGDERFAEMEAEE